MNPFTTVFHPLRDRAACLVTGLLLLASVGQPLTAAAASLALGDGVVVKFGAEARLIVRDRLTPASGVVLTSERDDEGGVVGSGGQSPAPGDWGGLRIEKSAAAHGALSLENTSLRYAGDAALTVRGWSPALRYLRFSDNAVGLRLIDGANPSIQGSSFLSNGTGIVAIDSTPAISSTQFAGNTGFAVDNQTPVTEIVARGNWWGHDTGPQEADKNPDGQGDRVSDGVDIGQWLSSAPLLNATVRLAQAATYIEEPSVILEVSCFNATEYRLAENDAFSGVSFQPLSNGRAQVEFALSAGDGHKSISAEFRDAGGTSVTASLDGGVLLDTLPPEVSISQPVSESVISESMTALAEASDASGIAKVQFFVDDELAATSAAAPYTFQWDVEAWPDGPHRLKAVATDQAGRVSEHEVDFTQSRVPVILPEAPGQLSAVAQASGRIRLSWVRPVDASVTGYNVYRSDAAFESPASATKINPAPVTGTSYDDLLLQDGVWTYRVVSLNSQSVASLPSNAVEAISDGTAPRAVSIAYTPQGRSDPVTGRVGQGRVDLVLTVSEALRMTPYLAIVPAGGAPLTVELTARSETTYSGSFLVGAATPAGVATALFSARDIVGNQGSDIDAGASLLLDTAGPILSHIAVTPAAPIDNDDTPALQVTFRFDKAPAAAPQISYRLSGAARSPQALALTPLDATTYRAEFTLPTDAGLSGPETLSFAFQAQDDLDNISTRVAAANAFQVYRGELPPADIPAGLTATAQAGGKVRLAWQAVDQASAYQIYRQGPDQSALEIHLRASGAEYIDATPADGLYRYAVASVRQANDQETLSGQSAAVEVTARATAPGAPQNLTLTLTGQGILASWQAPFASEVDHYKLYRGPGTQLDSIEGLIPLKTHIKSLQAYDTDPSPSEGAYVVTAVDAAGNESALSNSPYLNASLLPVRKLRLEQIGTALPQLSWSPPNGSLAGYLVYVGPENARIKLTASPINATQFTDTGYTSGERHYSVATVDANDAELGHDIILPSIATQIAAGLPLKRGIMNKLQIQLANTSTRPLDGVRALVRLPVDRDSSQFEEHHSEALSLAPGETRLVPVIVGGYAELPARASALIGVDIEPAEGDHIRVAREQTLEVGEGALVVGMATEDFTRGGVGKLRLTIENTTDVDIELLTATAHGSQPSTELRFKLLDADGNVLATQAYQQVFGANVVTLTNGLTVARITAGASYLSDPFELNVPAASPNTLRVRLEVDTLRYNSGKDDEIRIAGRGSETTVSLLDTFYTGEVTDVTPISSFGDSDIVISGHAIERATHAPLANARLNLILNQQGFERRYSVLTDAAGQFVYTFTPTLTDAGLYKVSAVHPEITDRPEQRVFTINRVTAGPSPYKLDIPKNYPFDIPFKANAGAGTTATHLRLELNPASQPTGELPAGLTVELPAPVNLAERQTLNIPVRFTANNDAQPSGSLILDVVSDEHPTPLGRVRIDYRLSEASPHLVSTPSYIETGLAQGGSQIESLTVKNNGLQDAIGLVFTLTQANGNPAPAWASIASQANGTLSIGQTRAIDLAFTPPAGTTEGIYEFRLNVAGQNIPAQALNVYVSLTQSGKGGILFKASDIYTATIGKDGRLIAGLAGATVTLQNEDVPSISAELKTDSQGEALFEGLPAGRYQFRVRAPDHQEVGGRLTIKPGITATQPVFLDYNLITVEWSVREITLEDRYEITLNATYETDVPAAVVMMQPVSVNLPKMAAGDVYYGELTLTNYGLVRADDLIQEFPSSDSYFRYEFLVDMPETLEAKQRITIPYRVIALQSLDAADGDASGGGCYSYTNTTCACYNYECANGDKSSGRSCTTWLHVDNSTCPGGSGGWSGGGGGGIGDGGGFGGAGTSYQPMPGLPPCINKCDGACCIPSTVGGGGWGPRY